LISKLAGNAGCNTESKQVVAVRDQASVRSFRSDRLRYPRTAMSVTIPFEAATSSTSGYGDIGVYADTWTTMNASASARPSRRADTWTKTIQLPANAKAAGAARDHLRRCVRAWNAVTAATQVADAIMRPYDNSKMQVARASISDDATETAILLTSELVTNALTHGESPVTVAVSWSVEQLRVEVHDRSRYLPAPWPARIAVDDEAGRGLLLVDTLATDWGFYRTPGGKAVYFTLDCPANR
jgi:anti-sigma regulatory factor (Ser/Thr protein kinase)